MYHVPGKHSYFAPISIFDSLVYQGSKSFRQMGMQISAFPSAPVETDPEYAAKFETNQRLLDIAIELYQMATSGDLEARYGDGPPLKLFSPEEYHASSSIAHVDESLADSPEFVMLPTPAGIKESVDGLMRKYEMEYVYGPQTLNILEGMGYATVRNPQILQLTIAKNLGTRFYKPWEAVVND